MLTRKLLTAATALLLASCGGGDGGGGSGTPSKPTPAAVAVTVSPATANLGAGGTTQFQCSVTGNSNTACTWSVDGAGTISASGLYTAPAISGTATVRAIAAADSSKSATATVTVTSPVAVALTPAAVAVEADQRQQFSCTVTGSTNQQCILTASGGGTISSTGMYTAPATPGAAIVTATAAADPSKKAASTVTVSELSTAATPWVTGYYAGYYWEIMHPPEEVDMRAMTHFVFARIAPGGGSLGGVPGEIVEGGGTAHAPNPFAPDPNVPVENWMIARAHAAGAKALLMFGGDGGDGVGFNLSSADNMRASFVKKVVDYLVEHDYDGIDMDWENRLLDGCAAWECGTDIDGLESVRRLVQLTKDIRAEANSRPRYRDTPIIITFAHYLKKLGEPVEDYQAEMGQIVDQYNMMSYGVGSTWYGSGWASWFTSPIYGAYWQETGGSAPADLESSMQAYIAAGIPRERIGVGIGFYGVPYGAPITGPRQNTDGLGGYFDINDGPWQYNLMKELGYMDAGTYHFDQIAQSAYRTYPGSGFVPTIPPHDGRTGVTYLSYENGESIHAKGKYIRETGAGGAIIWLVNYGYVSTRSDGKQGANTLLADVKCAFLQRGCPGPMTP